MLMTMLPDFLGRLEAAPHTMLGKYVGLYRIGTQLFFVMQAVSIHGKDITRSYDLKGSVKNRDAKPTDHIGKDMNFKRDMGKLDIHLDVAQQLVQTFRGDVDLLKHHNIMDFSLLLQVHDRFPPKKAGAQGKLKAPTRAVKLTDEKKDVLGAWYEAEGRSAITASSPVNMAFAAEGSTPSNRGWSPSVGLESQDGRYLFTFGLIDILVPFGLVPKLQYAGEQVMSCGDGKEYSRVPADFYCERAVEMFHSILGVALPGEVND